MSLWCDFLAPIFFAKSNLMDVIVFHDIICSFDFLCSLVERAQNCSGSKFFFCFEEMDQSLPTTEDGTAGFLEILDSVWSAKAPNWMSLRMICKNAFNERCSLNCLMWTILLLFRKMSKSYLIQLFTYWFQASYHADCELSVFNFFMLTFL